MVRIFSLAILFAALTSTLSAADQYRMCLRNAAGQISLPDESGRAKKTYFLDLESVIASGGGPQYFGGSGKRFKTLRYDAGLKVLTCEEVDTKKICELEVGKWINFLELP